MAKKLKDVLQKAVKNNPEPARGTNYVNPGQLGQYSAQNQVAEDSQLGQYLKSKGVNASVLTTDQKISHGKSNSFKKWRDSHKFEEVEYVNEDALLDRYLKSRGINPEYAPKNTKIAHSKSTQFIAWKKQHMNEESITESPKEGGKKKFSGMYNPAPKGTFAYDQALRKKKHDEIEKNQSEDGSGMTSAIDRLEKHLNKEEMVDEMDKSQKGSAGWNLDDYDYNKGKWSEGKPVKVKDAKKDFKSILDKAFRPSNKSVKEEVEQIDEISKSTLASYKDKSTTSLKNAQANRDAAEPGKHMSKGFADLHAKSDAIAKKRVKGLKGYLQRKVGMKPVSEDNFADPQDAVVKENTLDPNAATESPADGANGGNEVTDHNTKKPRSKLLTKIKSICQPVKEEMYDWEKDDKKQNSLGKKSPKSPSLEKEDPNALPNGEPKARAVMSGGKTMTGEPRDSVTIDPEMEARPDLSKNNKDDKDAPVGNKKLDNK